MAEYTKSQMQFPQTFGGAASELPVAVVDATCSTPAPAIGLASSAFVPAAAGDASGASAHSGTRRRRRAVRHGHRLCSNSRHGPAAAADADAPSVPWLRQIRCGAANLSLAAAQQQKPDGGEIRRGEERAPNSGVAPSHCRGAAKGIGIVRLR
jgi:hypothetical protein